MLSIRERKTQKKRDKDNTYTHCKQTIWPIACNLRIIISFFSTWNNVPQVMKTWTCLALLMNSLNVYSIDYQKSLQWEISNNEWVSEFVYIFSFLHFEALQDFMFLNFHILLNCWRLGPTNQTQRVSEFTFYGQ